METGKKGDPYGSLIPLCNVSDSQEERLRRCRFAFEHDSDEEDDTDPAESRWNEAETVGIVIVSPPESLEEKDDSDPLDVYHTPPEKSLLASSDEERSKTVVADCDRSDDEERKDGARGSETAAVDSDCTEGARAVDLGRDSDLRFFSELQLKPKGGGDSSKKKEVYEYGSKKCKVLSNNPCSKEGLAESPLKKLKISEQNLGFETLKDWAGTVAERSRERLMKCGSFCPLDPYLQVGEKIGMGLNSDGGFGEVNLAKRNLFDRRSKICSRDDEAEKVTPLKGSRKTGKAMGLNFESIEAEKALQSPEVMCGDIHVTSEKISVVENCKLQERAKVLQQFRGVEENAVEGSDSSALARENRKEVTFVDVLKLLKEQERSSHGDDDDDDDEMGLENLGLFEIAKLRGMTFPTPEWWSDEDM